MLSGGAGWGGDSFLRFAGALVTSLTLTASASSESESMTMTSSRRLEAPVDFCLVESCLPLDFRALDAPFVLKKSRRVPEDRAGGVCLEGFFLGFIAGDSTVYGQ